MSDTLTAVRPYQLTISYTDPETGLWKTTIRSAWPDAKEEIILDASEADDAGHGRRVHVLYGKGGEATFDLDEHGLARLLNAADRAHADVMAG
ncbi:hypothetical protein ACIBEJ_34795 [Nonomuraea sp. NPDC050790]|uniref:hypothetical protein n=1 Tax=Nonomuraea sp. NPDC050790 TaxID=3364371 RepID=UPI0037B73246